MSANDIAIKLENVNKVYRLGTKEEAEESFLKAFARMVKNPGKNYRRHQPCGHCQLRRANQPPKQ